MPSSLLSTQELALQIEGRWLLKGLNLSLCPGSFVAVTGASGSGKTTLLRTLAAEISPAEGRVDNQLDCPTKLAMIFQDLQLADGATALTNVLGGCLGRHSFLSTLWRFPAKDRQEASQLLSQFGLSEKGDQWASTLSRGERQRVAACRTLLTRPLLLLADEPVSSLDPSWANDVLGNLKSTITERKGCVVCALHNDEQVAKFADTVLRLDSNAPNGWKLETLNRGVES
jgi:phosphonate transport system ATP-binding protein